MVPIITVIGIFLILFGLQVLIQRVTLDSNRTLRPNYIGTTYVFPLTMSLVGVVLVAVGVRSPEMS